MEERRIIDTHAHIIDPARFPFADGPGYKPLPHEVGTAEAYCAVLDAHGVAHAVLVQPSGYGYDNRAALEAMARYPGRFKTIAVLDPIHRRRSSWPWRRSALSVFALTYSAIAA